MHFPFSNLPLDKTHFFFLPIAKIFAGAPHPVHDFLAVYRLDASTLAPFFQLQSAFIVFFAFLFLGERFSAISYLWMALMVFGSFLVSLDEKMNLRAYWSKATVIIVLAQIFFALGNLLAGYTLRSIDPLSFAFWSGVMAVPLVFFLYVFFRKRGNASMISARTSSIQIRIKAAAPLLISGAIGTVGGVALFTAFQSNVGISGVIALLTAPLVLIATILFSRFKPELLEHHTKKVYTLRAAGVLLILLGAVKLALN